MELSGYSWFSGMRSTTAFRTFSWIPGESRRSRSNERCVMTSVRSGVSATTVNHTNGKIAPIEVIESEYPVRLSRFELIPDSGGAGQFRGGLGFAREYEVLAEEASFSIRSMPAASRAPDGTSAQLGMPGTGQGSGAPQASQAPPSGRSSSG